MKYDFKTVFSRKGTWSSKWETMYQADPTVPDDVVPFSVADMEFKNPPQVQERLTAYLKNNILGYTRKSDEYLDAVVSWMHRRHHWEIEKDWIIDYPGIVPAFVQLLLAFTESGDGVILMTPVYYPFYNALHSCGRKLVENNLLYRDGKYTIDFADLEAKAKEQENKLLILCNPHNPVGRVWTEEELRRIGQICLDNHVLIISDDIHADLIMDGYKHTVLASLSDEFADNCIVCTAPSKTFNTAGLFTSNIIIKDLALRKTFLKQRKCSAVNYCNVLGYQSCIACYNEAEDWLDELLQVLNDNRLFVKSYIEEHIPEIKVIDLEGTYLQWLDCKGLGLDHLELEKFMQQKARMFMDEGYIFGECGVCFERMNIACPRKVLEDALSRLDSAVQELRSSRK